MTQPALGATSKQIIKHASIFGAGAILFRLASIILLPVYTRFLRPADYGVIAILDLAISLLSIVIGGGIASAATRAHYEKQDEAHRNRVWWTAVLMVMVLATVISGTAFLLRTPLAALIFGPDLRVGSYYLSIAFPTLWIGAVLATVDAYFRALKASSFVVQIGLLRLVVNIVLNVTFLAWGQMGAAGVLWGNLISAGVAALVQGGAFVRSRPTFGVDRALVRSYWLFGWPLVVFGLFSVVMHEADRYVLRLFMDLREVGLYSVAYQIGQGVNTLVVVPFASIWSVLIYEIAKESDAKVTYARVFKGYVFCLSLVLLLAALFTGPILRIIAPAEYAPAADIVPVVCLAYLFFSLHEHFKVPALLASRTGALLPIVMLAAAANVSLNLVLIPQLGALGAAWASVLTFVLFSFGGLYQYRKIDRYQYPFVVSGSVVTGMAVTYLAFRTLVVPHTGMPLQVAVAAGVWLVWLVVLFGGVLRELSAEGMSVRRLYSGLLGPGDAAVLERSAAYPAAVSSPTVVSSGTLRFRPRSSER